MHHRPTAEPATAQSRGVVNLAAPLYDFVVRWFVMRGREQRFRAATLDAAGVRPGDAVLDVGCGTGTLAIQAKHRVGDAGSVAGVEPSKKLLAGARRKAAKERLTIDLRQGGVEQLDFPDESFVVVTSSFVMHHLPDGILRRGLGEIRRVLRPGGRLLIVDFKRPEETAFRPEAFGESTQGLQDLPAMLRQHGFTDIQSGEMPFRIRSMSRAHKRYGYVQAVRGL
jgi:ubiquinone/menaquinone biosynthesis C-methylase UbiE